MENLPWYILTPLVIILSFIVGLMIRYVFSKKKSLRTNGIGGIVATMLIGFLVIAILWWTVNLLGWLEV